MTDHFEFRPPPQSAVFGFRGVYRFLSNFWPVEVVLDGVTYASTEHAYQAAKTLDPAMRAKFATLETPSEAKRLGESITVRPDWDEIRRGVMKDLLWQKFQREDLITLLLATDDAEIVEANSWHDTYWGWCTCATHKGQGENNLGELLMEVRSILREQGVEGLRAPRKLVVVRG